MKDWPSSLGNSESVNKWAGLVWHFPNSKPRSWTLHLELRQLQLLLLSNRPPPSGFVVIVILVAALQRIVWQMTGNLKGCLCACPWLPLKQLKGKTSVAATKTLTITKYSVLQSIPVGGWLGWFCSCVLCLSRGHNFSAQLDKQLNPPTPAPSQAESTSHLTCPNSALPCQISLVHIVTTSDPIVMV